MSEIFLEDNGALVPESVWLSFVSSCENEEAFKKPKEKILLELQEKLVDALKRRIPPPVTKIGVLFSGGVDSTLIAFLLKRCGVKFTCITVGFQDGNAKEPEDIGESRSIADELGFNQESAIKQELVLLNLEDADKLFARTANVLGPELTNVVNVGVGAVEVAATERGKELGIQYFFGGLGSEELFAGYDRHEKALAAGGFDALHKECIAGLRNMYQRDLRRDVAIAQALGVQIATPFLDEKLVSYGLRIPSEMKISTDTTFTGKGRGDIPMERTVKKLILREAAVALGLPERAAFRPKRAAQYGSRLNNAMTMLAQKKGFNFKEEYLKGVLRENQ
jgi:asparagine synthetase B (glutamine-hydrolysing)